MSFVLLGAVTAYAQTDLPWWPVYDSQLKIAPCKTLGPQPIDQIKREITQKSGQQLVNDQVFGIEIENDSPILIQALKTLTTRTAKHGGTWGGIHEPQIDLQAKFSINPVCNKVLCAVEKIWGSDLGPKILWIFLKHGYNTSEYAFDSTERFTLEELNDVVMTLQDLPSHLVPLGHSGNQRLVPIAKTDTTTVIANSTIILMTSWRKKSSLTRQQTLFHELGHNLSTRFLDKQGLKEWQGYSGWEPTSSSWRAAKDACLMSEYSKATPGEDFAESVVAYRYDANNLKNKCPEKYEFIRTKVLGTEYLDSGMCESP